MLTILQLKFKKLKNISIGILIHGHRIVSKNISFIIPNCLHSNLDSILI